MPAPDSDNPFAMAHMLRIIAKAYQGASDDDKNAATIFTSLSVLFLLDSSSEAAQILSELARTMWESWKEYRDHHRDSGQCESCYGKSICDGMNDAANMILEGVAFDERNN